MAKKTVKKAQAVVKKTSQHTPTRATGSASKIGIRPLGDRVVIRPLDEHELGTKSPSGIIIPDTVSKEKPEQGVIVAVGQGKLEDGVRIPLEVAVGDRVVFSKYGYDEVKVGGTEYYVVAESNVLAVLAD